MRQARILVVDDQDNIVEPLRSLLESSGFIADKETDPFQVQTRIQKDDYDVVLLDLHMPTYNGLDVLVDVKTYSPDSKVILMTGIVGRAEVAEAMRHGAADFIERDASKSGEEYIQRIRNVLKQQELLIDYRWNRLDTSDSRIRQLQLKGLLKLTFESIEGFQNFKISHQDSTNTIELEFENSRTDMLWRDFQGLIRLRCQTQTDSQIESEQLNSFYRSLSKAKRFVKLGIFILDHSFSESVSQKINRFGLVRFAELIDDSFSKDELHELCFKMGIDYDHISKETKKNTVIELILYCKRRGQLSTLLEVCRHLRSEVFASSTLLQDSSNKSDDPLLVLIDRERLTEFVRSKDRAETLKKYIRETISGDDDSG